VDKSCGVAGIATEIVSASIIVMKSSGVTSDNHRGMTELFPAAYPLGIDQGG